MKNVSNSLPFDPKLQEDISEDIESGFDIDKEIEKVNRKMNGRHADVRSEEEMKEQPDQQGQNADIAQVDVVLKENTVKSSSSL